MKDDNPTIRLRAVDACQIASFKTTRQIGGDTTVRGMDTGVMSIEVVELVEDQGTVTPKRHQRPRQGHFVAPVSGCSAFTAWHRRSRGGAVTGALLSGSPICR